ncbi:MAG: hypothetical protein RL122_303 [Pseudomonadota bacterium]|jgi:hypothetical protein|uniref:Lipoprotein n=1 Tax=Thiothrix fructosivorans TaxID=111770 RepID=A0A8B0SD23_9GAMM|nr:hypothetical protein [Thiothrix fructosivorans]MBO0614403.1 hypothetical protein [Thiothrix fructosivorans]QTX09246.1 hypothetical protein J1836_011375 [Thiothrix fructosivorans]
MKNIKNPLIMACVAIMCGCASVDSKLEDKLESEFAEIKNGPNGAPYKNVTSFSDSLGCMDRLMLARNVRDIPVMVEDIDDKTEAVKTGVRDMLVSAISEMTYKSHGIKLILYGKDSGNLISFLKAANNNKVYEAMPLYDIQGSISQFDKGVTSVDASIGLFARRDGGLGAARGSSLSVVALDLNMISTKDMSIVPGVSSKNSVAIFQRGDSLDADASINKFGVYFDINLNRNEGQAQAVRSLVELAAVEIVGKLTQVPYEQCLKN